MSEESACTFETLVRYFKNVHYNISGIDLLVIGLKIVGILILTILLAPIHFLLMVLLISFIILSIFVVLYTIYDIKTLEPTNNESVQINFNKHKLNKKWFSKEKI